MLIGRRNEIRIFMEKDLTGMNKTGNDLETDHYRFVRNV